MKIGFSGTREGMNREQIKWFKWHLMTQGLEVFNYNQFYHGCCIGADAQAHKIVLSSHDLIPFQLYGFPSNMPNQRDDNLTDFTLKRAPADPIARNHDIVDAVELLIACPKEGKNTKRSGTWSTIRYAQSLHLPVIIIPKEPF